MFYAEKTRPAQLAFGRPGPGRSRPLELLERRLGGGPRPARIPLANVVAAHLIAGQVLVPTSGGHWQQPAGRGPVALIAGDLLDADRAWFDIIFLGLDGAAGGGTRYGHERGIAAAQRAVLAWGRRHFRQPR